MRKDSISVIGDKDSVLAFKAIGINAYAVTELQEARELLKTLARNYKVIFIIDELAVKFRICLPVTKRDHTRQLYPSRQAKALTDSV